MYTCKCCNREFRSNKSLNGHLGNMASSDKRRARNLAKEMSYNQSPTKCLNCSILMPYKDRGKRFCTSSCSATFNNTARGKLVKQCKACSAEFIPHDRRQPFCSHACSNVPKRQAKDADVIKGIVHSRPTLRRFVSERDGWLCRVCTNSTWMDQTIPLELDHIDGNASNNFPINLRLICPNCHAQTTTYKARNKGFGRTSLGL